MEDDTVREDLGYRRPEEMERETYPQVKRHVEKKRIRLLSGDFRGETRVYAVPYADELIANRRAEEVGTPLEAKPEP